MTTLEEQPPRPTEERSEPSWPARWIENVILACLFLIQTFAFFTFVDRELLWAHCFSFDQATYLHQAYSDFEILLTKGLRAAVMSGLTAPVPNGAILPTEAALLFSIFGASRKVALGLLFAHWLLCQWVFYLAGRKLGKSAEWGFAAVGLLLAIQAPTALLGGLFDFRYDGVAMTSMGVIAALIVLSDGLLDRRLSVAVGIAAIYAILVRHIVMVYIAGGLGLYGLLLVITMFSQPDRSIRRKLAPRFVNLTAVLTMVGMSVALIVIAKYKILFDYYLVGHLIGGEKEVRAVEAGAFGAGRYTYYLNSILFDQMGVLSLWLLAAFLCWQVVRRVVAAKREDRAWHARGELHSLVMLVAIMMTAYIVLSYDIAKSPIVGNVFCGPLILTALLLGSLLGRPHRQDGNPRSMNWNRGFAAIILAFGFWGSYQKYASHSSLWSIEPAIQQIVKAHELIGNYVRTLPGESGTMFSDRNTDYQIAMGVKVDYYERHGRMISLQNPVEGNVMLAESDWPRLRDFLRSADVAFITESQQAGETAAAYPTTRMLSQHREEIVALAKENLQRIGGATVGDHKLGIYTRARVRIEGESGGWLTSAGIRIYLKAEWLRGKKGLVLEGTTLYPGQLKGSLGGNAILVGTGKAVPIFFSPLTPDYRIELDLREVDVSQEGDVEVQVKFDRYFVPRKEKISADDRELVISAPKRIALLTVPSLDWERGTNRRLEAADIR